MTTLLGTRRPGTAYGDVLDNRDHLVEALGLLPSSLPYKVTAPPEVAFDLPDSLRHTVRLVGRGGHDDPRRDASAADLLGQRLTLSYVPATEEDEALSRSYGGLTHTPPYLIEVRPQIKSGGVAVAIGSGSVGLGVRYTLRLELHSPGGTQVVTNTAIAGNLTAIGLGAAPSSASRLRRMRPRRSWLAWLGAISTAGTRRTPSCRACCASSLCVPPCPRAW